MTANNSNDGPPSLIHSLTSVLQHKVPNAKLKTQVLPMVPEIKLALIEETYPQASLSQEQIDFLMDSPPYWAFCWASGQIMSRYLLDNATEVKGKTVVDFGSGSGVVAIAAKLAGAKRVIALDIDPAALIAAQVNARLNSANMEFKHDITGLEIEKSTTTLLIADVFYDRENLPMLKDFILEYGDLIVADSRVKPDSLKGLTEVGRYASSTVPDLGESADFNSVGVYRIHAQSMNECL